MYNDENNMLNKVEELEQKMIETMRSISNVMQLHLCGLNYSWVILYEIFIIELFFQSM
jgi:hypothetical protein